MWCVEKWFQGSVVCVDITVTAIDIQEEMLHSPEHHLGLYLRCLIILLMGLEGICYRTNLVIILSWARIAPTAVLAIRCPCNSQTKVEPEMQVIRTNGARANLL